MPNICAADNVCYVKWQISLRRALLAGSGVMLPAFRDHRAGLRLCFPTQQDAPTMERLLANAAMASWTMTRATPSMTVAVAEGLPKAQVPILLLYGARDALVMPQPAIARARALNPRVRVSLYDNSGHAPFLEEPQRFTRDLAGFVSAANR